MHTVYARTYNNKTWEQTFIDKEYAMLIFNTARKAVDCANVDLLDATTGEVLICWDSDTNKLEIF